MKLQKNQELKVEIIDLTYEGKGVAKIDNYPLFIENALPGEQVTVKILKVNKHYGFAKVLEYHKYSPNRRKIDNQNYLQTGIAPLQHLDYHEQLKFKRQQVINSLQKFGLETKVALTTGMDNFKHYRNKAQIPVRKIDGKLVTGFYKQKSHQFIPMTNFYLHEQGMDETLAIVTSILNRYQVSAYDEESHQGVLRHIIIRQGHYSKEQMVILVTRKKKLFKGQQIAEEIMKQCPNVVSVIQNVNSEKTNVILGPINNTLAGQNYLTDNMLKHQFEIAAPAFYQVNTEQAEKLYQKAIELSELQNDDVVVDAYCGIGTITLSLAPYVKHVYGVEVVPEAIENAQHNAQLNDISNVSFVAAKAEEQIVKWQKEINPRVIFVDPPRKGLAPEFIATLQEIAPEKIVYISCNPATFARDIAKLSNQYHLSEVYPFDLFPETTHVECVAMLERID